MYNTKQKSFIDGLTNGIGLLDIKNPKYSEKIYELGTLIEEIHNKIQKNEKKHYENVEKKTKLFKYLKERI